jgi:GT2 family glycosyltransferase
MPPPDASRIAIILVNYNGAADTIECLESIRELDAPHGGILAVVIDNGSPDDSPGQLRNWMSTGHPLSGAPNELTSDFNAGQLALRVILLLSHANLGFAAGCNAGLARADRDPAVTHFWLLNNDTTVDPRAAMELLATSDAHSGRSICGSTLLYYDHPNIVQAAAGARYLRTIGRSYHFYKERELAKIGALPLPRFDYIVGASMFFSRGVLGCVGYLPERYFLYAEETDWCTRARKRGIRLEWARNCFVYHKEGRSTGAGNQFKTLGDDAFYYIARNNLFYVWDHARLFTPSVVAYTLLLALRYAMKGDKSKPRVAWEALKDFWKLRDGELQTPIRRGSIS